MKIHASFQTAGWSLIPGPENVEGLLYSTALTEIVTYDPRRIADALLAILGVRLIHDADPSWYEWSGRWEKEARWIEIGMSTFEDGTGAWGGAELKTDCYVSDVVTMWLKVQEACPAVWLHDPNCRIYTPEAFVAEYAAKV